MNRSDKRSDRGENRDLDRLRNTDRGNDQRQNFDPDTKPNGLIDSLFGHLRDKPSTTAPITSRRTEGHGAHQIATSTERHSQSRSSNFKQQQNKKSQTSWFSSSLPWTKKKGSSEVRGCVVQNQIGGGLGDRNGDNCLSEVHAIAYQV